MLPDDSANGIDAHVDEASRGAPAVHVAHDYATQLGGAERVAAVLGRHYGRRIWVSFYDPAVVGELFGGIDVTASRANRISLTRRNRLFLSIATLFVVGTSRPSGSGILLCSSSGWSHGLRWNGPKVVYCHNPARWLYQTDDFFKDYPKWLQLAGEVLLSPLRWLDRRWARSATLYVANSRAVASRIEEAYGIAARVINPPMSLRGVERQAAVIRRPNQFLTVSRARSYKGLKALVEAFEGLPDLRLVVVGAYEGTPPPNVEIRQSVPDDDLAELYLSSRGLVAVSREDFGLTPIEAHAHGCPTLALRAGGYLDSLVPGVNGLFLEKADPSSIQDGVRRLCRVVWDEGEIRQTAQRFTEERFFAELDRALADASRGYADRA